MKSEDIIVNGISSMSGVYHAQQIFNDWIHLASISIYNEILFDKKREELYMSIAAKYSKDQLMQMCEWTAILAELLEEDISDYLGHIYMRLGSGSSQTGQFFTPFHISYLTAKVGMNEYSGDKITKYEPSCGGGGMILAIAKVLKELGYNYQEKLRAVAGDIDQQGVLMTYLQTALCGIAAKVQLGDSLSTALPSQIWYTPEYIIRGYTP